MGLFDKFKKPSKPAALGVSAPAGTLLAPVTGKAIPLSEVSDPVFSSGAMGKGCGILPEGDIVYAPTAGTLSAIGAPNFHALGMVSDDGTEVLIHIGVDTVEMKGEGFTVFGTKGAHVSAGEPLIQFSSEKIKAAGYDDVVIMAITNSDDLSSVEFANGGTIGAGKPVVSYLK